MKGKLRLGILIVLMIVFIFPTLGSNALINEKGISEQRDLMSSDSSRAVVPVPRADTTALIDSDPGKEPASPAAWIIVSSPTSSSSWTAGNIYTITWSSYSTSAYVDILMYKGVPTGYLQDSVYGTADDGTYYWTVPSDASPGSDWWVRVRDSYNTATFDDSYAFEVKTAITVTSPTGSSIWTAGTTHGITWTSKGSMATVNMYWYKGATLKYLDLAETNDGYYSWNIPSDIETGSDWNIKIVDASYTSVYDYSSYFTIQPSEWITVTSPTSSEVWTAGTTQTISWSAYGVGNYVDILMYKGVPTGYLQDSEYSVYFDGSSGSYSWAIPVDASPGSDWW
ncbi:MAG: Ser-Thr-rich GPI-anchored membrane family protein, partial [Candidatus Odinarchaeota archaeon]